MDRGIGCSDVQFRKENLNPIREFLTLNSYPLPLNNSLIIIVLKSTKVQRFMYKFTIRKNTHQRLLSMYLILTLNFTTLHSTNIYSFNLLLQLINDKLCLPKYPFLSNVYWRFVIMWFIKLVTLFKFKKIFHHMIEKI